jgi:hypothetical protein
MQKLVLVCLVAVALALALFSSMADAQVTASLGSCMAAVEESARGQQFCISLRAGSWLWSIVLYTALFMAGLAGLAIYLGPKAKL